MKNTPFTQKHIALGAKMAEFAGYNMPISYSGINDEHATVRNNAGVFDVSHMGEFILKGENALDLIQRVTTNDAAKLTLLVVLPTPPFPVKNKYFVYSFVINPLNINLRFRIILIYFVLFLTHLANYSHVLVNEKSHLYLPY